MQPDPQVRHCPANGSDQLGHRGLARQINAPGGDLDAGDDDLLVPLFLQLPCLLHRQLQGRGAHRSPGVRDDAVGAEIYAAVLNLQHGPGPFRKAAGRQHLKAAALQGFVQGFPVDPVPGCRYQHFHELSAVSAAAQHIHPQLFYILSGMLAVTAAYADDRIGTQLPEPADHRPVLFVCHGGDGAGVDDIAVAGLIKAAQGMPLGHKQLLHGLGLILICFAP